MRACVFVGVCVTVRVCCAAGIAAPLLHCHYRGRVGSPTPHLPLLTHRTPPPCRCIRKRRCVCDCKRRRRSINTVRVLRVRVAMRLVGVAVVVATILSAVQWHARAQTGAASSMHLRTAAAAVLLLDDNQRGGGVQTHHPSQRGLLYFFHFTRSASCQRTDGRIHARARDLTSCQMGSGVSVAGGSPFRSRSSNSSSSGGGGGGSSRTPRGAGWRRGSAGGVGGSGSSGSGSGPGSGGAPPR